VAPGPWTLRSEPRVPGPYTNARRRDREGKALLGRLPLERAHTQIYPELCKLENEGLVAGEELPRGQRGKKLLYRITDAGGQSCTR
jgi:DNA-binding PadR family transcriptional regulator